MAVGGECAVTQIKQGAQTGRAGEQEKRVTPPNLPHDMPVNIRTLDLRAVRAQQTQVLEQFLR